VGQNIGNGAQSRLQFICRRAWLVEPCKGARLDASDERRPESSFPYRVEVAERLRKRWMWILPVGSAWRQVGPQEPPNAPQVVIDISDTAKSNETAGGHADDLPRRDRSPEGWLPLENTRKDFRAPAAQFSIQCTRKKINERELKVHHVVRIWLKLSIFLGKEIDYEQDVCHDAAPIF